MTRASKTSAFQLALASCEPASPERNRRIARLAKLPCLDWRHLLGVARHHRVEPLVHSTLTEAGIHPPEPVRTMLQDRVRAATAHSLILSAESVRLQHLLLQAGVRSLLLKGGAIGALAYGDRQLKCSWDVDLLVDPENLFTAAALLKDAGYRRRGGGPDLTAAEMQSELAHEKEILLERAVDALVVELHWRLHNNPFLLGDWTPATLPAREVAVPGGSVLTLGDEQHYVYLAVHGASHAWFRLKWLADYCWWLASKDEQQVVRLHDAAVRAGAGRCSAQGLLLAHRMLGLDLPLRLRRKLERQPIARLLVKLAEKAIASRGGDVALEDKRLLARAILASQLLLSSAPGYRRAAFAERWKGIGSPERAGERVSALRRFPLAFWRLVRG
jgi:hypothetical protein